jgi:plastocyanin
VAGTAYEEIDVTDGGSIRGVVRLVGSPPKIERIRTTKDQDYCGKIILSQKSIISQTGEVQNVVVSVESITKGKRITAGEVIVAHQACQFVPRVQGATVGSQVTVVNNDTILHNAHAYFDGKTLFNLALPAQGMTITRSLKKEPGMVEVKCDLHEWTRGWIVVKEHPYFSVTDANGAFRITDIPDGTYRLSAWHEALGTVSREVTVTSGSDVRVDFELRK